ncbi:MAG: SCO family protein [Candidatus Binatia bacterium]
MNRSRRSRLLVGALILSGSVLLGAGAWAILRYGVEQEEDLPALGKVPEFLLLASNGQTVSPANLAGSVWVADFIFTRCGSICPTLSRQMAKLQGALARAGNESVRLVSFSVDPAHDTPEVLRDYATRFHADPNRWIFVTGERAPLYRLLGDGFHLAVAERAEGENGGDDLITHTDHFVLVDRELNIRGYYHGTDDDSMKQLLRDLDKAKRSAGSGRQSASRQ